MPGRYLPTVPVRFDTLPCCHPTRRPGPSGVALRHADGCKRGKAGQRVTPATARLLEAYRAKLGGSA